VELQNGDAAPSYVAGTSNFYAVTRVGADRKLSHF
jgi:membrane-bound lytic murein transglycosylase B